MNYGCFTMAKVLNKTRVTWGSSKTHCHKKTPSSFSKGINNIVDNLILNRVFKIKPILIGIVKKCLFILHFIYNASHRIWQMKECIRDDCHPSVTH